MRWSAEECLQTINNTKLARNINTSRNKITDILERGKSVLTDGSDSWAITRKQKIKVGVIEMRLLRTIEGKTIIDKIINEVR